MRWRYYAPALVLTVLVAGGCWSGRAGERAQRGQAGEPGRRAGLTVGPPVELAGTGALNPTVAVDGRSGAVYAAWAADAPAPEDDGLVDGEAPPQLLQVVVAASRDGGTTFSQPVAASPAGRRVRSMATSPTQVAVGPQGQVYVLYLEDSPRDLGDFSYGASTVWLARSDDGATTFGPPVAVTGQDEPGVVTSTQMATLFVAPDGDLFVSFLDYREVIGAGHDRPGATQLRLTRSPDGGRSWSPSVLVTGTTGECAGTQAAQGKPDGPLLVTARAERYEQKGSPEPVRDPIVSVSTDDGATFGPARPIADDRYRTGACPDVAVGLAAGPDGTVQAAWYTGAAPAPGVYHTTSGDNGATWSRPRPLLSDDWMPPGDVRLVVGDRGAAWVVVEDRRDDKEDRVQVVRVTPDGDVDVSSPWPGRAPSVAVAGDGVVVAWHSRAAHGNLLGSISLARVGS